MDDAYTPAVSTYAQDRFGNWLPIDLVREPTSILVSSGIRRVRLPEVQALVDQRTLLPRPYRCAKAPMLSEYQDVPAKLEYVKRLWIGLSNRRLGFVRNPKTAAKEPTLLRAFDLLDKHKVAPVVWYWWGWGQDYFRVFRRGIPSETPSFTLFWQPARAQRLAPKCSQINPKSWRKPQPNVPQFDQLLAVRSRLLEVPLRHDIRSAGDATKLLDDVCTYDAYMSLLDSADRALREIESAEAAAAVAGEWVWL